MKPEYISVYSPVQYVRGAKIDKQPPVLMNNGDGVFCLHHLPTCATAEFECSASFNRKRISRSHEDQRHCGGCSFASLFKYFGCCKCFVTVLCGGNT